MSYPGGEKAGRTCPDSNVTTQTNQALHAFSGSYAGTILFVGFGSVGQALLPLLFRHFDLSPRQIRIVTADERGMDVATLFNVAFTVQPLTPENHREVLGRLLPRGGILINVSVDVASLSLIDWCQDHGVRYLDTCIEPWVGGYTDPALPVEHTTNWWLREQVLARRGPGRPTAVVAHGANPGLISHFVKAGLERLAGLRGVAFAASAGNHAEMARDLGVRVVQIAERDTQHGGPPLPPGGFANTWSADGLMAEAFQRAELGWGSHEGALPAGATPLGSGGRSLYLPEPGVRTRVRSWVPSAGEQSAYLLTHHESLSIADLLTVADGAGAPEVPAYRPTVYYAYRPCPAAETSLEDWAASGFAELGYKFLLRNDLSDGGDELGALFVFDGGAYWYGSTLTLEEARHLAPCNNATTLQVAAPLLAAVAWLVEHPDEGVVEAESLDHEFVLDIARPYLGRIEGILSAWNPKGAGRAGDLQFSDFIAAS